MGPELLSRIASKGFQSEVDGTEAVLERALRKLRDENIERLNDTVMVMATKACHRFEEMDQ
jgi:hypothetical protein